MRKFLLFFSFLLLGISAHADNHWKILKDSWTTTDEKNYSAFVQSLGSSGCTSISSCLKSSANPYRNSDVSQFSVKGDCGKFPYLLRGYFAWKNALPFSWVNDVRAVEGAGGDLRYSQEGNIVTSRHDLVQTSAAGINAHSSLQTLVDEVFTAMYRFNPDRDQADANFFDFVPVKINRTSVRPGTMIYDPNGHVAVVYKVETDGRILYFDAHPDDSVSHGTYGKKFVRSRPGMGAGFKNFRPLRLVGAVRAANGSLIGGQVVTDAYPQIDDYSLEQFYGTNPSNDGEWQHGQFEVNHQILEYYDFVRTRLAVGELYYHPVEELASSLRALCGDIKDRVIAVNNSLVSGMQRRPHPETLPENIYGTAGDWETYSSPSRDARLKTSFLENRTQVQNLVELYRSHSPRVIYTGNNLGRDLRAVYERETRDCTISYTDSDSRLHQLSFDEVANRLFKLSFDPYQCPELRWGADTASELASCPDDSLKRLWFEAEQNLRNQIDRTYDVKMGFTLEDLRAQVPGSGVLQAPDTDLKSYLRSI